MKKLSIIFFAFVAIVACTVEPVPQDNPLVDKWLDIVSKAEAKTDSEFFVNETDIAHYIHMKQLQGKSKGFELKVESVTPYSLHDQVCAYIINYDRGFEILSADKRSPIPLVCNYEQPLDIEKSNEAFLCHLDCLAEEVFVSLNSPKWLNESDQETKEKMMSSLEFWSMVNAEEEFINSHSGVGKGSPFILPPGHWELVQSTSREEVYDSIPHLTSTHWHYDLPYKYYCPYDTIGGVKCGAGCLAVAAAQMLYYLHGKLGVPAESPTTGSCTGYVYNNSYVQTFSNYSSTSWSFMYPSYDPFHNVACLMGDVGKKLGMHYQTTNSYAYTDSLVDRVFLPYGIYCTYSSSYNGSVIASSLLNEMPVLCAGSRLVERGLKMGHAFLVDSYKRSRTATDNIYEWVPDSLENGSVMPWVPRQLETVYSSPYVSHYRMNWGAGICLNDDYWCSMDGMWEFDPNHIYCYDREMIYGFSNLQ